jgi:hypothetical protein
MSTNHTRSAAAWREDREMPQPWHLTFCLHSLCLLWEEVKELHRNFRAILNRASESGFCKLDALKAPVGSCETWTIVSFSNILSKHACYKFYHNYSGFFNASVTIHRHPTTIFKPRRRSQHILPRSWQTTKLHILLYALLSKIKHVCQCQ